MNERWKLSEPLEKYSEIDLSVLDEIQKTSEFNRFEEYDTTRTRPNAGTIRSVDYVPIHKFSFENPNLAKPFKGKLKMIDLRSLDKPMTTDEGMSLEDALPRYLVGYLADRQCTALSESTLIYNWRPNSSFKRASITTHYKAIYNNSALKNPFEKEYLLFPWFHVNSAFLTVVKRPGGALISPGGTSKGRCKISHFVAADSRVGDYAKFIFPVIEKFLTKCGVRFGDGSKFDHEEVQHETYYFNEVEFVGKAFVILSVMEQILTAQDSIPDLSTIGETIGAKTKRQMKNIVQEYRTKYAKLINDLSVQSTSSVVHHLINMRNVLIERIKAARRRQIAENPPELVTIDD